MKINPDLMQQATQLFKKVTAEPAPVIESTTPQASASDLEGLPMSKEAKQGVDMLQALGVEVGADDLKAIETFMAEAPGGLPEKLMALMTVVQKELGINPMILKDIHMARSHTLVDFLPVSKENKHDDTPKSQNTSRQSSVYQEVKTLLTSLSNMVDLLFEKEATSTEFVDKPVDGVHSFDQLHQALHFGLSDEEVSSSATELEPKANQIEHLVDHDPLDLLTLILSEVASIVNQTTLPHEGDLDLTRDTLQEATSSQVKMVLEEKITPRLLEVKQRFDQIKNHINHQLNHLMTSSLSREDKVVALSKVIDQLDQVVMKSDVGLYLGLKSERLLIAQSSLIDEARSAIMKGDLNKAEGLVKGVQEVLVSLPFKPTLKKAMALMPPQELGLTSTYKHQDVAAWTKDLVEDFSKADKSTSQLVNYLRRLGVNHETEVFQKVFNQQDKPQGLVQEKTIQNLKHMLLSLGQKENGGSDQESVQKALSHLNGQQMNMKVADKNQQQPLLINVPMSLEGHIQDVKVFIKSRQDKLKMDWKNFNMYFVLSTQQLGQVGIKVTAVDKKIRVDVQSDSPQAKDQISPLIESMKTYVESVGYLVTGMQVKAWDKDHPNQVQEKKSNKALPLTEGGFDFKI